MNPLELWKRGTPLSDAWVKFAPARLWAQYEAYQPGDIYGAPPTIDEVKAPDFRMPPNMPLQLIEQLGIVEPPVAEEMRETVFGLVSKGRLVPVGVPVQPVAATVPEIIPDTLIQLRYFKWSKSEIRGGTYIYRDVRLIRSAKVRATIAVAEVADVQASKKPSKRPPVRPVSGEPKKSDLRRSAILKEFRRLRDAGELPKPHNQTRIAKKLGQVLSKNNPDLFPAGRGLGEKNVYRILKDESGF